MAYTINENIKNMKEIVKSINFEKCTKRIDIRYGQRFLAECAECDSLRESRPETQTVVTYKVYGTEDRFVISEVDLKSE